MKETIIILTYLASTISLLSQQTFKLSYDIKKKLRNEIKDTSNQLNRQWYFDLDSLSSKDLVFAQGMFDSVTLIKYPQSDNPKLRLFSGTFFDSTKEDLEVDRYRLSNSEIQKIIDYLNNPNNYDQSECGSPYAEHELKLFKTDSLVLRVVISCDYSQIHLSPKNRIIKYGALKNRGDNSVLKRLIEEIKTNANNK